MTSLAAMLTATAVLLGATQSKTPPIRFEWSVGGVDVFDMKWTYLKTFQAKSGVSRSSQGMERIALSAVLTENKDETLGGELLITLQKATWEVTNARYSIYMNYAANKKEPISSRIRVHLKKTGKGGRSSFTPDQLKRVGKLEEEAMRRAMGGKFTLNTVTRPRQAFTLHNGRTSGGRNSIFANLFIQSAKTPNGTIPLGQKWREPNLRGKIPEGAARVDVIQYEVTSVSRTGATAKAGFAIPFQKPPSGPGKMKTSGKYTYSCSFTFAPEGYVTDSKEASVFVKKVDGKEIIYKQNYSATVKQQLTLKKRKPPKPKGAPRKK